MLLRITAAAEGRLRGDAGGRHERLPSEPSPEPRRPEAPEEEEEEG